MICGLQQACSPEDPSQSTMDRAAIDCCMCMAMLVTVALMLMVVLMSMTKLAMPLIACMMILVMLMLMFIRACIRPAAAVSKWMQVLKLKRFSDTAIEAAQAFSWTACLFGKQSLVCAAPLAHSSCRSNTELEWLSTGSCDGRDCGSTTRTAAAHASW